MLDTFRVLAFFVAWFTSAGMARAEDARTYDFNGKCSSVLNGKPGSCHPVMTTMTDDSFIAYSFYGGGMSLNFGGNIKPDDFSRINLIIPIHIVGYKVEGEMTNVRGVGSCTSTQANRRLRSLNCNVRDDTGLHAVLNFVVD